MGARYIQFKREEQIGSRERHTNRFIKSIMVMSERGGVAQQRHRAYRMVQTIDNMKCSSKAVAGCKIITSLSFKAHHFQHETHYAALLLTAQFIYTIALT